MCVDDFLYCHVDDRFGYHGNIRILIDSEIRFSIIYGRCIDEEFSSVEKILKILFQHLTGLGILG